MKKSFYLAPKVEQTNVLLEDNFLASGRSAARALGNSSVEEAEEYDNGSVISW